MASKFHIPAVLPIITMLIHFLHTFRGNFIENIHLKMYICMSNVNPIGHEFAKFHFHVPSWHSSHCTAFYCVHLQARYERPTTSPWTATAPIRASVLGSCCWSSPSSAWSCSSYCITKKNTWISLCMRSACARWAYTCCVFCPCWHACSRSEGFLQVGHWNEEYSTPRSTRA